MLSHNLKKMYLYDDKNDHKILQKQFHECHFMTEIIEMHISDK